MGAETTPLSQAERYLRRILEHVSDAVIATDVSGRVTFANPAAQQLYGIAGEAALGRNIGELLAMFDEEGIADIGAIAAVVARDGHWNGELLQRSLDGRKLLVEVAVSSLRDDDDSVLGSVSIVREISGRRAIERQIAHQATHDGLTGLLNRTAFLKELDDSLKQEKVPTLVFLDLNGFKAINDLHGHDRGDDILRVIGERLSGALRPGDAAGRFGGDEFVLLLHDVSDQGAMNAFLERIMAGFNEPVRCRNGATHAVGVSVGVAHFTAGDDSDSLIHRADGAMYEAKRSTEVASAYRMDALGHP